MKVEGIIYFVGILLGIVLIWDFKSLIFTTIVGSILVVLGLFGYFLMWFNRKKKE